MIERHEKILQLIEREKDVSVNDLSEQCGVSLVTIRSDLRALEEQNLLIRTHGGASLPSVDDISRRMGINHKAKQRIAAAAASLVKKGDTILLEAGSSIALMARELAVREDINVITNNAFVARQFNGSKGINVILLGGKFQQESETMVGPMIAEYLKYYNFSKVFLGLDGFTLDKGAMCRDMERGEVMKEFIRQGREICFLSDSSKFGKTAVKTVCPPEGMDYLITDRDLAVDYREYFRSGNVELLCL